MEWYLPCWNWWVFQDPTSPVTTVAVVCGCAVAYRTAGAGFCCYDKFFFLLSLYTAWPMDPFLSYVCTFLYSVVGMPMNMMWCDCVFACVVCYTWIGSMVFLSMLCLLCCYCFVHTVTVTVVAVCPVLCSCFCSLLSDIWSICCVINGGAV